MSEISRNRANYYIRCVAAFAEEKNISPSKAFNYIYSYNGMDFLIDCYDAEHTLSLSDAVEDLTQVCRNNGGTIE